jgi:hypothetical protein
LLKPRVSSGVSGIGASSTISYHVHGHPRVSLLPKTLLEMKMTIVQSLESQGIASHTGEFSI